jgi:putative (di)nucleoside polyphosphate hydrolase
MHFSSATAQPSKLPTAFADLMNDSMVQLLMAADGVSRDDLEATLRGAAQGLRARPDVRASRLQRNDADYRAGVGVMLLNNDAKALICARIDNPRAWQMPQGGIDADESPREAALRELYEEVGVTNVEVIAESAGWLYYDLPDSIVRRTGREHWRGQRQKWFLMRFLGTDQEINLATETPEFSDWRWVAPQEAVACIVDFKRDVYAAVVHEFEQSHRTPNSSDAV